MKFIFTHKILSWLSNYPTQSATAQGVKTLPAMLNDRSITIVCKVIGGLSADNFGLDFDTSSKVCASFQLLSGGQFNADFYRKIITDRQSFNMTGN